MPVIGFDERLFVRIQEEYIKKIRKVVNKNQDLYFNESHFVRCAIIKLLRDYDAKGKRIK